MKKKKVRVTLLASEPPAIELWETRKHAALFQRAFDRKLEVEAEVAVEGAGAGASTGDTDETRALP